VILTKRIQR